MNPRLFVPKERVKEAYRRVEEVPQRIPDEERALWAGGAGDVARRFVAGEAAAVSVRA